MVDILSIVLGGLILNNFVLVQTLGICPFVGVSKKIDSAVGMGIAVTFVLVLASLVTHLIYHYVIVPLNVQVFIDYPVLPFILVIASLVQIVEIIVKKISPSLYQSLGVYLPLITTNCIVLGVAINAVTYDYNLIQTCVYGLSAGLGFTLAIFIMAGLREKQALTKQSSFFEGFPVALITAAIMAMAFNGFNGLLSTLTSILG